MMDDTKFYPVYMHNVLIGWTKVLPEKVTDLVIDKFVEPMNNDIGYYTGDVSEGGDFKFEFPKKLNKSDIITFDIKYR
jgi:hypothetical protein